MIIMRNFKLALYLILGLMLTAPNAYSAPIAAVPVEAGKTNPTSDFRSAMKAFRSLPKSEKKSRIREAKKQIKEFREMKRAGMERPEKAILIILAILLPPLAVYLHQQEINNKFWISLVLTLLFWLPGVIYALVVVLDADS